MTKRIIIKITGFLLVLTLLGGCAPGIKTGEDRPKLVLALREGVYSKVIEKSLEGFEKEYRINCEIVEMSEEELHQSISGEKEKEKCSYDLCMVDGSWMMEYTDKGLLADLEEMGYSLDEDIITATTRVCYRRNHLYLAPFFGNVTVLLYNKLIVKRAGYEKKDINSLEDVMKICRYAQDRGNLGFMYRGDTASNTVVDFLPILSSFGGWVVDDRNRPTVDTPVCRKTMDFYKELIGTGKAETRDNLTIAIANNAAAMAVGWPGWYTPGRNATADYCAFSGKETEETEAFNANVYGIWTFGIPANAGNREQSLKLLKYLMDPVVQFKSVQYGGVPCRYSVLKDKEVLKQFPQYEEVEEALEKGIYRPIISEWPQFYEILGDEMKKIIAEEKTTENGLKDAQKRLEELEESL